MLYRLIIVSEIQTLIFTVISQLIKGAKSLPLCYVIKMQQYTNVINLKAEDIYSEMD